GGNLIGLLSIGALLHLRRRVGLYRRGLQRIGQQCDIDAAVLCATGGILVFRDWIVLAQPEDVDAVGRNAVLRCQILDHGIGPAPTQLVVVFGRTDSIGVTLHLNDVVLLPGDLLRKLVQQLLVGLGERCLVES